MNNETNPRPDSPTTVPTEQINLDTYNMLVKHMRVSQRQAKRVNLKAMSYEEVKAYHRAKGRIGK